MLPDGKVELLYGIFPIFFFFFFKVKENYILSFLGKKTQHFLPVDPSLSTLERMQLHKQLILPVLQQYSCCYRKSS